jgi:hypothetical protein
MPCKNGGVLKKKGDESNINLTWKCVCGEVCIRCPLLGYSSDLISWENCATVCIKVSIIEPLIRLDKIHLPGAV